MKKLFLCFLLVCFMLTNLFAQETFMVSNFKVKFYGFIKTDVVYDDGQNALGELSVFTTSEEGEDFRITARGSRFGFAISDNKISAKIEADFYGADGANTGDNNGMAATNDLRLRHAYIKMDYDNYSILAGQTWNLTPLEFPGSNNDMVLGYSGCLWYRVPQIRYTYTGSDKIEYAIALTRPTRKLVDSDGTESGRPGVQAYMKTKIGKLALTLSSGFSKWEKSDTEDADVYVVDLGYRFPLGDNILVNGQIWTGQNLYDYLGGIGNVGYETSSADNQVQASGGFMNVKYTATDKLWFNFCYGADDPDDDDLSDGDRSKNETYFANINTKLMEKVITCLEIGQNTTEVKQSGSNTELDSTHVQLSFKYSF